MARAATVQLQLRWSLTSFLLLLTATGSELSNATLHADRRPRIYMYPEAEEVFKHRPVEGLDVNFYGLDYMWHTLLKKSFYVETDPEKADYFYLPMYTYWRDPSPMEEKHVAAHLRSVGPWFDRKGGADHIFTWPGDFGRCEWGRWGPLKHTILIHHFGKVYCDKEPRVNPCDPLKQWGDQCDPIIGSFRRILKDGMQEYTPCHYMGRDIVVPPTPWEHTHRTRYLNPDLDLPREDLMFFAGPINLHAHGTNDHNPDTPWSDAWYSFGARQSFAKMYNNSPGVRIVEKHIPNYFELLSKAKFCLAAAGWGWGGRMKFAVMHGCIPVIVQDGILVEWEEQVPMHEYALRIPMWMLHKLVDTLEVLVRKGVADKMHRALECVWRLHWWSEPHGRAFDLVICELKSRLLGKQVVIDTQACTMECGDGMAIDLRDMEQRV